MCGISGAFTFGAGSAPDPARVRCMIDALAHRGPDDEGVYRDGPVVLGHRRLSIIDVVTGAQPLTNEDQTTWLIFNGEIYNYRQLRAELEARGHSFRTTSDTEVIVHLYEDEGDACLERLNGIFAIALWDARRQRLLLARDPIGVKPLYFAHTSTGLTFASELKALLCDPNLPRAVDTTALDWFLTYRFVPAPRTMLDGISKLRPGHLLVADRNGLVVRRYASPPTADLLHVSDDEAVELVRSEFEAAVERQMMSDVPIGAFLSGGVDSGAIVAAMSRHSGRVRTYSVGFHEGREFNELAEARDTAQLFGTEHHELLVSAQDCADALADVVWHLDEPISTSSAIPLYLLAALAHRDVKVALAGQGADELFAGYTRYLAERYQSAWVAVPAQARWLVGRAITALPRAEALKRGVQALATREPAERFRRIYAVFGDDLKAQLVRSDMHLGEMESAGAPLAYWLDDLPRGQPLAQMQAVDLRMSLADDLLHYGDRMAMAHAIELRVPFLDVEFVRLVERLPTRLKLRGLTGKYVWKHAARRMLPAEVVKRPKRGFATPIDAWFRGPLNTFVREHLLGPRAAQRGYFDLTVVERLIDEHESGRQDRRRQLFSLLAFELWHQEFVDADGRANSLARAGSSVAHLD